jgi:hypothetical protein
LESSTQEQTILIQNESKFRITTNFTADVPWIQKIEPVTTEINQTSELNITLDPGIGKHEQGFYLGGVMELA